LEELVRISRSGERTQALLAQIIESSENAIFSLNLDGMVESWNKAAERLFGYAAKEVIGQPALAYLIPPDRVDEALQKFNGAKSGQTIGPTDTVRRRKDGSNVSVSVMAFPILDAKGEIVGVSVDVRDITERKQAEERLKLFRTLLDQSNDSIEIIDPITFRLLDVNEGACRALDYTREELLSMRINDIDPKFAAHPERYLESIEKSGQARMESIHRRKDGSMFPVEVSIKNINLDKPYGLSISRDITERKQAEIALEYSNRALATLSDVNRNLVHATDEHKLLLDVCQTIVNQQGYRMAWVGYLEQDETKTIRPVAQAGIEGYLEAAGLVVWADTERGRGPSGRAARSGQTQVVQNFFTDERILPWREQAMKHGLASGVSLPLAIDGKVIGVLSIYSELADAFNMEETRLLEEMASDLAFGVSGLRIRNERDLALNKIEQQLVQLQDNLEDTVKAIAAMVEMRDPYTAGHEAKVAELAVAIAREMGLPDEQAHGIHLAGEVHDLGKIQIPAEILSKPARLNEIEYQLIKAHPQAGYEILKGINFPWPIAQMVLQHHERIDGSGYPQGLKGEEIILEARILCVADVVEAMHSHRPYRPGLGLGSALNEIKKGRNTLYDPVVADACLKLFQEERFKFEK
jgi:PAS domain S-box-containing protein